MFDIVIDKKGTTHNNEGARKAFVNYMDEQYLSDVWRIWNPDKFNLHGRDLPQLWLCLDSIIL